MQQPGDLALDRTLGSEVAVREGARALVRPTVAEVGGRLRVSVEIVDPASGVSVYQHSADGHGVESVLPSLDSALADLWKVIAEHGFSASAGDGS